MLVGASFLPSLRVSSKAPRKGRLGAVQRCMGLGVGGRGTEYLIPWHVYAQMTPISQMKK